MEVAAGAPVLPALRVPRIQNYSRRTVSAMEKILPLQIQKTE
jgi:hypothetical protein